MSAVDELREAAARMRRLAEAATPGPWDLDEIDDVWHVENDGQAHLVARRAEPRDAAHIAAWSPEMALAVADWLGRVALDIEWTQQDQVEEADALKVARAFGRDGVQQGAGADLTGADVVRDPEAQRDGERGSGPNSVCGSHSLPAGPNEDIGQCRICMAPMGVLRPANEQYGLHLSDCSLPRRHRGYCVGGGHGHAPTEIVRGFWPGMDAEIDEARQAHREDRP